MIGRKHLNVILIRCAVLATFICGLWIIHGLNWASSYRLNVAFGLIPRRLAGLDGVIGMPFLHGSVQHLISNTVPLVVMGGLLATTATRALLAVNLVIVGLGGVLVWLFAGFAIHIGASGLVFGWFGFLVMRGLVDRSPVALVAATIVGGVYGSLIWGVFPGQPGVSWEAHLFGFLAGIAAALLIRTHIHEPRLRDVERR